MKVYIGKYLTWIGPYQLADLLKYIHVSEDRCHQIGKWLDNTWVHTVCQWIYNKQKRNIKVRIDDYDVWSMDTTLAYIILPMLKKLKQEKHGSAYVDDVDVPQAIRSTSAPAKKDEWDTDDFFHDRWDYVIDEMIWAFEQCQADNDWESQYWSVKPILDLNDYPEDQNKESIPVRWKQTGKFNREQYMKHAERIDNGLRLFGRYFLNLWD